MKTRHEDEERSGDDEGGERESNTSGRESRVFSGGMREGRCTKHSKKLVICRVQGTSVQQAARGDGGGFVKCREPGPVAKVTSSKDKLK